MDFNGAMLTVYSKRIQITVSLLYLFVLGYSHIVHFWQLSYGFPQAQEEADRDV